MSFLKNKGKALREWIRKRPTLNSVYLILKNTFIEFSDDGCPHMAAGLAYYIFFSIFPIFLILISIAGFRISSPDTMANIQKYLMDLLPAGQADFLMENVKSVAQARGSTGLIGLIGLIWAGRGMFLAMEFALNKAWGNAPSRSFMGRNLVAVLLIFLIGVVLVLSMTLSSVLAYLTSINLPILNFSLASLELIQAINQWVVTTLLIFLIFLLLYKILPHSRLSFRDVIPGAIFATFLWKLAEFAYIWYIANMANLAQLYGSIGSIIGILLWLYIAGVVFLLGAEFNISYLRRQSFRNIEQ